MTTTTADRVETEDMDTMILEISDDEKQTKQSRKKMLITGGLATVATIHAAHSVYQSMEKREARKKAFKEGDITAEQAKKGKNKKQVAGSCKYWYSGSWSQRSLQRVAGDDRGSEGGEGEEGDTGETQGQTRGKTKEDEHACDA